MTYPIDREHFAADLFLREMRLQWLKQHPSADPATCPVKTLDDYPPSHRSALVKATRVAQLATTRLDELFETWTKQRQERAVAG